MAEQQQKLSILMRAGAFLHSQIRDGDYATYDDKYGHITGTCAIGAACIAWRPHTSYAALNDIMMEALLRACGIPIEQKYNYPQETNLQGQARLFVIIVYLNDDAGESREAIADWLESIGL